MNLLATKDNFDRYLNPNFIFTYLQFRLKYFIHDKMQSPEYRKHKVMWDGFLVGLEEAYVMGLARLALPLTMRNGSQLYPDQVTIETWLPDFKIKDNEHETYLRDWRHKAFAHIDTKMIGRVNREIMTTIMDEVLEAMSNISKIYNPSSDYKTDFENLGYHSEGDFLRLLELIKNK